MQAWLRNRSLRAFVAWSTCFSLAMPSAVIAGDGPTAVEKLASRIDKVEHGLEQYGSIVIKTPDVWGESRLMRHRSDVENQLRARLNGFDFRINAVQSTRDAAFLATAIALQEQLAVGDVNPLTGTAIPVPAPSAAAPAPTNVNAATAPLIDNSAGAVPRSGFSGNLAAFSGTPTAVPIKVGIEPVVELDQLNRYLQHLNELRRLNEGDDNSDTPGYALNLIRIPVSVLPGRKTEEGFGAEVQITIDPYISEEILPLAFKDFVINGVVDRISFDVFQIAQRSNITILANDVDAANLPATGIAATQTISSALSLSEAANSSNALELPSSSQVGADENEKPEDSQATFEAKLNTASIPQLRSFVEQIAAPGVSFMNAAVNSGVAKKGEITTEPTLENQTEIRELANQKLLYVLRADVNHFSVSIPASQRTAVNLDSLKRLGLHAYDCLVHTGISEFTPSRGEPVSQDHRVEHGLAMPEVETLLRREAVAAYEFLSQPSAAYLWTQFCTPELAQHIKESQENIVSGDTATSMQLGFFEQVRTTHPKAYASVTAAMAWQIIVESALQNEQLVKDMRETASLKNCPCIPQDWMPFFGPNPVLEARMAFREYVKCKWPIHVFALDPVTQDQNIADSFSQRREMQMAIAISAANRGLGGQALSRFVRRMEYDLETIELNRTAIAFSHGDNTFGWRFYPRVQSPPVPSNLRATVNDLLIGGQSRDSLVRTRKLEPGIRECTALVVMPSFVPQVTVDVQTNYFRLAKHTPIHQFMHRKPGYESSMELSRELTELRRLQQQCMNDAHLYRDGEVFRLCKAVERLEDRLPLQTHNVTVPWENELGGFEVFQSGTQVLEPELHGWYGAPGVIVIDANKARNAQIILTNAQFGLSSANLNLRVAQANPQSTDGVKAELLAAVKTAEKSLEEATKLVDDQLKVSTDTAVFLVGKNFSVLNCQVIAGGVDVTGTIQVINRNLMQVRIPSTISTVTISHDPPQRNVVVHLATPHGATSRLLIPVAGDAQLANAEEALKTAKAAKALAEETNGKLAAAITASENSTKAAQRVSLRMPVPVLWGDETPDKVFCVKVQSADGVPTKLHFCPVNQGMDRIPVVEQKQTSPWADADSINAQGLLMVYVTFPGMEKKRAVGPWPIADGNIDNQPLTAHALLDRIMEQIGSEIPCPCEDTVKVEVEGFVKYNNGQPVVRIDNKITFELKPEKK